MPNKVEFSDKSFVVHGITGLISNAKVSAWYDQQGNLRDAEIVSTNGQGKSLPMRYTNVRRKLESIGKAYAKETI